MFDVFVGISLNLKIFSNKNPNIFNELSNSNILNLRNEIRNKYNTIIVGANTIKIDNPNLLNKKQSNIRIVVDKQADLDLNSNIFINKPEKTYLILLKSNQKYMECLKNAGVNVIFLLDASEEQIIQKIKDISIGNILIEGGAKTISLFLKNNLISNFRLVRFPIILPTNNIGLFENIFNNISVELQSIKVIDSKYVYEDYKVRKVDYYEINK